MEKAGGGGEGKIAKNGEGGRVKLQTVKKKLLISWWKVDLGRYITSLAMIENIDKNTKTDPSLSSHRGTQSQT